MTETLDLERSLAILRRRFPIILLCLLLAAGSAYFFSKQQAKRYTAKASLVFNNAQISQQVAGLSAGVGAETKSQQDTNVKLLELGSTAAQTAAKVGHGLTAQAVKKSIAIAPEGESNVVDIEATAATPALSTQIANVYAHTFVADQLHANHHYFSSALRLVEHQLAALSRQQRAGPQGLALQDRAQSLAILSELRSGDVEVAQPAGVPTGPSSPKTSRNLALGAVLGLLLGLGIAFLLERLDHRLKQPEDLERVYGLPLLGAIPESGAYKRQAPAEGIPVPPLPTGELEAMRMLRARLRYFNVDRHLRVVLLTSAAMGDGKTTVTVGLAEAAASMGSRVLIVESDLRRPTIAQLLGARRGPGLAEVLIKACALQDAVQETSLARSDGQTIGAGSVSLLSAGFSVPNPTGMIESNAIEELLRAVASTYDLVLIDTPPLSVVPDAIPLLRKVDGVVLVGRLHKSTSDHAVRLRDELKSLEAPVLGVVANGYRARDSRSYGYYYYRGGDQGGSGGDRNGNGATGLRAHAVSNGHTMAARNGAGESPVGAGES